MSSTSHSRSGNRSCSGLQDDCDIRIDDPDVAARHAEIRLLDDNSLQLKDLGFGTLLNGEPVSETMLGSGDEIRIGTCRWMLQAPGLRPERVLTEDVVQKRTRRWSRVLIWTSIATAAAAVAVLKFKPEWVEQIRAFF